MSGRLALLLALVVLSPGCVRTIAINTAADALAGSGSSFSSDDDPELIRDAAPLALKLNESLIEASPGNEKLLLAAASGFTQYGYAFVQQEAEALDEKDPERSRHDIARARRLYARARGYGMRGLEAHHPGFEQAFAKDRKAAVKALDKDAVPLLYWTAAAQAAEIAISKNDATLLGELPQMETLMDRALELDEAWGRGAIHEFYVSYEASRSGGDVKKARAHFDRAVALTKGKKMSPYLSWAESVCVKEAAGLPVEPPGPRREKKNEFLALCDKVIAFNADEAPEFRLVNLITQERARRLKARVDDLFAD
jgi:hypothetical protein